MNEEQIREQATEEFFKNCVHVYPVDWDCAELKYEGWVESCPNLIAFLKGGKE